MDKSPYAPYLHTNYFPSASEFLDIKDFLTEPLARLSTLDAKIQRLNLTMLDLYLQRHALSEEIEAHRALISPFRRLPLEIMGEIFAHCLPTHHNAFMSVEEAPLLLGRVCSVWRSTLPPKKECHMPMSWSKPQIDSTPKIQILPSFF